MEEKFDVFCFAELPHHCVPGPAVQSPRCLVTVWKSSQCTTSPDTFLKSIAVEEDQIMAKLTIL